MSLVGPFEPSIMLASNAGTYISRAPFQVISCRVGYWPSHKHLVSLERLARDKTLEIIKNVCKLQMEKAVRRAFSGLHSNVLNVNKA
jgi:hypothetical protein